jgi:hypothetical protein
MVNVNTLHNLEGSQPSTPFAVHSEEDKLSSHFIYKCMRTVRALSTQHATHQQANKKTNQFA